MSHAMECLRRQSRHSQARARACSWLSISVHFECKQRMFRMYYGLGWVLKGFGEGGIRTLGTGFHQYNGLANRRFQPLTHLSNGNDYTDFTWSFLLFVVFE